MSKNKMIFDKILSVSTSSNITFRELKAQMIGLVLFIKEPKEVIMLLKLLLMTNQFHL